LRCMMFLNWECPAMRLFGSVRGDLDGNGGLIGLTSTKIKDLAAFPVWR
jgi:hypothetical protein